MSYVLLQFLGTPGDPEAGVQALRQHLVALGESKEAQALRQAFAIDADRPGLLKERRRMFLDKLDNVRSTDTLVNWEDVALRELQLRLLAFAGRRPDLYQFLAYGWLLRRHTMQAVVHDDHMATIEWREVVALRDGLDTFQVGCPNSGRIVGADSAILTKPQQHPGGLIYDLAMPRCLRRGESHTFAVRTATLWDYASMDPVVVAVGFHEPTVFFDLDVRIATTEHPTTTWWFHQLHPIEVPGRPHDANALESKRKRLNRRFEMLYGGFVSGVAWH